MISATLTHTCPGCAEKDFTIAQLTQERDAAYHDPVWGIDSRQGIERRMRHLRPGMAVLVIDIDDMHERNATLGDDGVDWRVAKIFMNVRSSETPIGRWKRGDEVVLFAPGGDIIGLGERILRDFYRLDMSATGAICYQPNHIGIAAALTRVAAAKQAGQRGRIFVVEGGAA